MRILLLLCALALVGGCGGAGPSASSTASPVASASVEASVSASTSRSTDASSSAASPSDVANPSESAIPSGTLGASESPSVDAPGGGPTASAGTSGAAQGEVILSEGFSDATGRWPTGKQESVEVKQEGGAYKVTAIGAGRSGYGIRLLEGEPNPALHVEADVQPGTQAGESGFVGILCAQSTTDFNLLLVGPDRAFAIARGTGGQFTLLKKGVAEAVPADMTGSLRLAADCMGGGTSPGSFTLTVNGQQVASAEDPNAPPFFGGVGMYVESAAGSQAFSASFDNVEVRGNGPGGSASP